MAHIDFWPSPRAGGEWANGADRGGGGSPALHKPQARKGGETAPVAKRSASRAETVQPLHRGGRRPLHDGGVKAPLRRIRPKAGSSIGAAWSQRSGDQADARGPAREPPLSASRSAVRISGIGFHARIVTSGRNRFAGSVAAKRR
ncbi:MAG: hypothetical protein DI546_21760 [Rhizobium sp.]|nr:MAG: hypothetical protein DI546_21760 [Rhizobium sp.]